MQSPSAVCDNVHLLRCRTLYKVKAVSKVLTGIERKWLGNWIFCKISLKAKGDTREKIKKIPPRSQPNIMMHVFMIPRRLLCN